LKADGRSSPKDWYRFYLFLQAKKEKCDKDPPVPLILAASDESNATKHERLSAQLYWANENGCLDDVFRYLIEIPVGQWNASPPDGWFQSTYPS